MARENLAKLACKTCEEEKKKKVINYITTRNKKKIKEKLELKKFCKKCKKHTPHRELK